MKLSLFSRAFESLKDASVDSVIAFFETMLVRMIIIYLAFAVFLAGCLSLFVLLVYGRLKEATQHTNLLLRIIPAQEVFDRKMRLQLGAFMSSL